MGFIFESSVAGNTAYHIPEGLIYVLPSKSDTGEIKTIIDEYSDSGKALETKYAKQFLMRIMF